MRAVVETEWPELGHDAAAEVMAGIVLEGVANSYANFATDAQVVFCRRRHQPGDFKGSPRQRAGAENWSPPGTRTSPGQSIRGPPTNPYRDDEWQSFDSDQRCADVRLMVNCFPARSLRTPAVTATSETVKQSAPGCKTA
jgi:hypothetical protein